MRPLELRMTAFGSYAEETTIRFSDLRHGLYLVTGDTGAGKTTIFDAIMFALYGTSSGRDRENNTEMLHSDYVPRSVDTVVVLAFAQDGRECTVTRTIHFKKKHGGAGVYHDPSVDAELIEPDRPVLRGAKNVSRRCEALLGLNDEQFRKIIMLAQGEFKEFLKADSDKKGEILGKLFDSAPYQWYQKLLCRTRDALKARRDIAQAELETLMNTAFLMPEGADDEERLRYAPHAAGLTDSLGALIDREAAALAALKEALEKRQAEKEALITQRGAAEIVNDQLAALERAVCHSRELEAAQAAYDGRRQAMVLAERALRRALPAVESCERAEADCRDSQSRLAELAELIGIQERSLDEARRAASDDASIRARTDDLTNAIRRIDEQLPLYDDLEAAVRDWNKALGDAADARVAKEKSEAERRRVEGEIESVRQALDGLKDIDVLLVNAQARYDKAVARLDALAGEKGLRRGVQAILEQERAYEGELEALRAQTRAAADAQAEYGELYRRFIAGQAGLLASELRTRVEREGEARCPVCGSLVRGAQLDGLAALDSQTPDKGRVDLAREAAERREKARSDQDRRVAGHKNALESDREHLVERAGQWLAGGPTWESLSGAHALDAAIAEARREQQEAEAARDQRLAERDERDSEATRLSSLQAELGKCERAIRDGGDRAQSLDKDAGVLEEKVNGIRKQLTLAEDKARATALKEAKRSERDALVQQLERHSAALRDAESALNTSVGRRSALEQALAEQVNKRDQARENSNRVLAAAGFADAAAVREALLPMGGRDGEAWLEREQRAQHDYESDKLNTRRQIEDLTRQTAGKQPVDLKSLDGAIRAAQDAWSEKNSAASGQERLLENHRGVAERVGAAVRTLEDSQAAWERIDKLASMAAGASGGDGKRSFERYVLSAAFQDVLEMANRRLDRMSGGRYELALKEGAKRQNSAAGLDIDVLDHSTGQQRPSASLSGGEAFFTSLSLALGLSDVVQSHAGGRRMDALFIDEGFGTLSDGYLDKALEVLNQLTEGNRLVGIISHVDRLDESIPQKIRVYSTGNGSRIETVLS